MGCIDATRGDTEENMFNDPKTRYANFTRNLPRGIFDRFLPLIEDQRIVGELREARELKESTDLYFRLFGDPPRYNAPMNLRAWSFSVGLYGKLTIHPEMNGY